MDLVFGFKFLFGLLTKEVDSSLKKEFFLKFTC